MSTTRKTRIVYDYQIFSKQQYGGISRYFCNLAEHIVRTESFDVKVLAGAYVNQYLRTAASDIVVGFAIPKVTKTGKLITQANISFSKLWLQSHPVDIIHETFFSSQSLAAKHTPTVLTVHDMIDEKFYPDSDVVKFKEAAIRRADHIICVSKSTRNDLLNLMSIDPQKVSVIYHGHSSSNHFFDEQLHQRLVNAPYILYVGDRYGYKNFSGLLKAYTSSEQFKKYFKLVCFGGPPFSVEERSQASQLGIAQDNLLHFAGSDVLLKQLYRGASAFVYPSMYEGFGIPPLEAMSLSCPVVCSNTSSIPEVVGNASELFNPYDVDSIVNALEKVLFSTEYAKHLVELGLKQVQAFSWKTCAEQTSLVYSSLM